MITHSLTTVYENDDFQITGVTVSKTGRVFVNYPRWSDRYLYAVTEIAGDGTAKPFPDEEWNGWDLKAASASAHFVCVQSVVVDEDDSLWVLDPAAPMLASVVPGGPKLVEIDLSTNRVSRVILFDPEIAKVDSYLNDVRIDKKRGMAYITDSGRGGLIVIDLNTGRAHRALDGHPSVKVEEGVRVVVDGKELLLNGKPPQFNSDGIALSPDGDYVYYKAVTAVTLYRVKTQALRDSASSPAAASGAVETVAKTMPTDGLWIDGDWNLYLTDIPADAVSCVRPDGNIERLVSDRKLQWPDTLSQGPDGAIYVSASHINNSPPFNKGKSTRTSPYAVFKFRP
jgi:sugar lactone lactonase YvrE